MSLPKRMTANHKQKEPNHETQLAPHEIADDFTKHPFSQITGDLCVRPFLDLPSCFAVGWYAFFVGAALSRWVAPGAFLPLLP